VVSVLHTLFKIGIRRVAKAILGPSRADARIDTVEDPPPGA
jgi:hypothetical protein